MEGDNWILLLSIVALLCGSAFFSVSETAISTFNKIRMKKKADDGDEKAKSVLKIWDNYDKTLSTILIGNNILNITSSALATIMFTSIFGAARGAAVASVVMTLLVLVFAEITPKRYGKDNADSVALGISGVLGFVNVALTPLSFVLSKIVDLLRVNSKSDTSPSITEEELIYMMDAIEEEGVLEEQERDLVQSALEFDEITIKEILTPRVSIAAIDIEDSIDNIKKIISEERFSRIPVFEKTIDTIIGVLYSRDFLLAALNGDEIDLRKMIGEPLFVHKSMKLSHLLASFKSKKINLAVVVDEYGGTLGIVTMEDVLEELVGDIWDEDDEIPSGFTEIGENDYEVAGNHELFDMLERLGIEDDGEDADYSTVGGWALGILEHIPKVGEDFTASCYKFTVLEMEGHRLKKLGAKRLVDLPGPVPEQ